MVLITQIAQGSISRTVAFTCRIQDHSNLGCMVSLSGHSAHLIAYHMQSVWGHPHWIQGHVQCAIHLHVHWIQDGTFSVFGVTLIGSTITFSMSGIALTRSRVIFKSLEVTFTHSKHILIAHAHTHPNFGTDGTPYTCRCVRACVCAHTWAIIIIYTWWHGYRNR